MDGSKNPETYEKLKSLGIVDLDPTEFSGSELSDMLSFRLMNAELTAAELDEPLEEDRRLALQEAVDIAVTEFRRIRSLSSPLLPSTRLKDMAAGQAKAYFGGHCSHEKHFSDTLRNVSERSKSGLTKSIPYCNEGGPVYHGQKQAVFDAFGKALVPYKALIGQINDGITQEGIPYELIDQTFRPLLATHRLLFKRTAKDVIEITKELGADKIKKAEEWISSTDATLETVLKAVGFTDSDWKDLLKDESRIKYE
ncbi:hypothetical protein MBLNU13_g07106t2 [Cladosporium sp. NU13]